MVQSSNCILKPDFQTSGGHDKSFKMYHFYIMIFMSLPLLGAHCFHSIHLSQNIVRATPPDILNWNFL